MSGAPKGLRDATTRDAAPALLETVRVYGGVPFRLESHLARMRESARALGLPAFDLEAAAAAVVPFLAQRGLREARLRIVAIARGPDGRPAVTMSAEEAALPARPAVAAPGPVRLAPLGAAGHKTLDRREHDAALSRVASDGADEALFRARDGRFLEGTKTNLFCVMGGRLATPPADGSILPGVTRAVVLEIAVAAGLAADERALSGDDLARAEEIFLTGTVSEVWPVAEVAGLFRGPAPGPVTARVADLFRARILRETAASWDP